MHGLLQARLKQVKGNAPQNNSTLLSVRFLLYCIFHENEKIESDSYPIISLPPPSSKECSVRTWPRVWLRIWREEERVLRYNTPLGSTYAPVAQWIEHLTSNQMVESSNLPRRARSYLIRRTRLDRVAFSMEEILVGRTDFRQEAVSELALEGIRHADQPQWTSLSEDP